nr:GGDEF domain-containing protein [Thalassotalea piscium]
MKIKEKNRKLSVKNSQLKLDSQKDPLTGLSNRRGFESFITRYNFAEENIPSTKHSDAILIMDIDHFKSVNDTYGHSAGDYVLKEIARILTMNIRDNEIVVRWGGEEFLMYFRDLNKQHISKVVNRLLKHISQSKFQFEQQTLNVTMSIGFIYSPFNDITGEKLDWEACIKLADEALYLSKHSGRNRATGVIESNDVTNNELRHTPLTDLVATNKINIIEITNKND